MLASEKDFEPIASHAVDNPFFQSDLAFATQDLDVPRTYAQVLRLPESERDKWITACRRECHTCDRRHWGMGIIKV